MGHRASTVRREPVVVETLLTTCVCVYRKPLPAGKQSRYDRDACMYTHTHVRVLMARLVGNAAGMALGVRLDGTVCVCGWMLERAG